MGNRGVSERREKKKRRNAWRGKKVTKREKRKKGER